MSTPTSNTSKSTDTAPTQPEIIAPLWKRFMSMVYDSFLVVAISMGYFAVLTAAAAFQSSSMTKDYSQTVSGLASQLGWVLTLFAFYFYFWHRAGQTVGMKAWRLKIVSNTDERLSVVQCLIRFFGGFISFALLGLGFWWALVDKQKATVHDKLSNSRIVVTPKMIKNKDKKVKIPDANKR